MSAERGDKPTPTTSRRKVAGSEGETQIGPGAGCILGGRYRLIEILGAGGMGVVWRARHLTLEKDVAVKLLPPELARDPDASERLLREARRLARIEHPGVATVIDCGRDAEVSGTPQVYLAMDLVRGPTLKSVLARRGALPPEEVVRILAPLAEALDHAHRTGCVHRDLKPANVIFTADPDQGGVPRIIDFGVATEVAETLAGTGYAANADELAAAGTPAYMAPEQILGRRARPSMDVWALAVLAYQMLTDRLPFPGPDALRREQILSIDPEDLDVGDPARSAALSAALRRALAKDPEARTASAGELVGDLSAALAGAMPEGRAGRPTAPPGPKASGAAAREEAKPGDPDGTRGVASVDRRSATAPGARAADTVPGDSSSQGSPGFESLAACRAAARAGDPEGMYQLGLRYEDGRGVKADRAEALKWYQAAAEAGHAAGLYQLAYAYRYASGVEADLGKALDYGQRAEAAGHGEAANLVGVLYALGEGVEKDPEEAARHFARGAEGGSRNAQYNYGYRLAHGMGVEQDLEAALHWLRLAADRGDPDAQFEVGDRCYRGTGTEQDLEAALHWFRTAAGNGHKDAQFWVGWMLNQGEGVAVDTKAALDWYRKAAEQGMPAAMVNVGVFHENGDGVPADAAEAARWYQKAADKDHASGFRNLARLHLNGSGVEKDLTRAGELALRAKELGDTEAEALLVRIHEAMKQESQGCFSSIFLTMVLVTAVAAAGWYAGWIPDPQRASPTSAVVTK